MLFVTKLMLYPHTALEAARLLLKDNKLPALAAFVANFDHESSTPEQVAPTPPVLAVKLDDHSAEDVLETVEETVVANADSSSSNVSPITVKRWRMDIRRTKSHEVDHYNFLAPLPSLYFLSYMNKMYLERINFLCMFFKEILFVNSGSGAAGPRPEK